MQTAAERLTALSRERTVRIVYSSNVPADRIVPCPYHHGADFMCRDEATLDRLLAKAGMPLQKGFATT